MIQVTKQYIHFKEGQMLKEGDNHKPSSFEVVMGNGTSYYIPKTHAERSTPISPVNTAVPTVMTGAKSLDDLLGATPQADKPFVTKAPGPKPKPKPKMSLGDNQTWLTDYTNGVLPTSGIDLIITSYKKGTWNEYHSKFIPKDNETYVWEPNVLEALVLAKNTGERVLLTGSPGTGKTSAHKQFAFILQQPFVRVNGKDGMEPASLVGIMGSAGDGKWQWFDGPVALAMREGYYICIDEVFKLAPGIQVTLQPVYEKDGMLILDEKPGNMEDKLVTQHKHFFLSATDNVKGLGDNFDKSAATQMQDTSSLDRFGITEHVPYLSELVEGEMLVKSYPTLQNLTIKKLVQIANLVRKGYDDDDISLTLSPRGLGSCCRIMEQGVPVEKAFKLSYLNKLADRVEVDAVSEFINTVSLST